MISVFISMSIFAIIGAISPGPVNIIATSAGANYGFKGALPHVLGASVSYAAVVLISGIGASSLIQYNPVINQGLQILSALYLLWLAFKIFTSKPLTKGHLASSTYQPRFRDGVLVQCLNPKAWMVALSGVSLFVTPNTPNESYLILFGMVSLFACFIGVGTWALLGQALTKLLNKSNNQIAFNRIMGILLGLTVISVFYK